MTLRLNLKYNTWGWNTDHFIAYSKCKYTIVTINTTKDQGKSVQYCLQKSGKKAPNILEIGEEHDIEVLCIY